MLDESQPGRLALGSYLAVYVALIALTLLTVGMAFVELHEWHLIVGLAIAGVKATLVGLFFMHMLHSGRLVWLAVGAGLFWIAILMGLTLSDYLSRHVLIF